MSEVGDSGTVDATAEEVPAAEALRDRIAAVDQALEGADVDGRAELEAEREALADQLTALADPDDAVALAEEFKPSRGELVVADPRDEQQVFVVLDRHDEEMIIEEFQRRALKVMLYDFTARGTRMIDLSYAGVLEAVRLINRTGKARIGIVRDSLEVEEVTEDIGDGNGPQPFYVATVGAEDAATGMVLYGTSSEPKYMHLKDGSRKWDVFARAKAINKAQRNALKTHIPEPMRQTLIAQYKGDPRAIRQIQTGAGAEALAELPPPLTDERAVALKNEARGVYSELKDVNRLKLLPGAFFQYLTRSEHSHERLEEFVAYLRGQLEEARSEAEAVPS